ncbi:MAG: restriction endonuclease [Lacunisphaera sp.]
MAFTVLPFKKAAEKILRQSDIPLSPKEIVERALDEGLIETDGVTPEATMGAQLYVDLRRNPKTPFQKVGRGKFTLRNAADSAGSAELTIDRQNRLVQDGLRAKLISMDPAQFEVLVAELLEKLGYEDVKVTGRTGDKGIDITARLTMDGITSVKTVVQVKRYKTGNNVAGAVIAQLRGSAETDQRGLVITTSEFTKDGFAEAVASNKMPVALVNGDKLIALLLKHEIGVKKRLMPVYALDSDYFDNAETETEEDENIGKKRGLWPLPGGIDAYVETLFKVLDAVATTKMNKREMIRWFMKTFEQVKSEKTAGGYVNVPRAIGVTALVDGQFQLTVEGRRVHETKDREILFDVFAKHILGIDEIMEFLKTEHQPQTEADVLAFLKESLGVEWTTFAQVNFRLLWLVNLGKLEKVEGGYSLTKTS